MIVNVRLDVSDDFRRAIRQRVRRSGLATRKDITDYVNEVCFGDVTELLDVVNGHEPTPERDVPELVSCGCPGAHGETGFQWSHRPDCPTGQFEQTKHLDNDRRPIEILDTPPDFGKTKTPTTAAWTRMEAADAAADDAICRHCGRTKERHGKSGFTCLASGAKTIFEETPQHDARDND